MTESSDNTSPAWRPAPQDDQNVPQLSCNWCKERKIRCDKLDPCTNCTSAGVTCSTIYRNRLPRGRYASRSETASSSKTMPAKSKRNSAAASAKAANNELQDRIRSLETLVQQIGVSTNVQPADTRSSSGTQSSPSIGRPTSQHSMTPATAVLNHPVTYSSSPSLIHEPLLTLTTEKSWDDFFPEQQTLPQGAGGFRPPNAMHHVPADGALMALGIFQAHTNPETIPPINALLSKQLMKRICPVYLAQVDPIIKILHRPSIERWLIHGEQYLHYTGRHPSTEALSAAICYAAVSSLTEQQSQAMLQTDKAQLVDSLCKACEATLYRAGLISTRDITVLQAFVLYLVGKQYFDQSLATWTLVAVAVRISESIGLQSGTPGETFFEQQMRTRLWLTICVLDYQTTLSQNTQPLIKHDSVQCALSQIRHVNDYDFNYASAAIGDCEEITDMTFAYVLFQHQLAGRALNFSTYEASSAANARQQYTRDFEEKVFGVLRFCNPESSQLAWFIWHATQCHVAIIRILESRPLSSVSAADDILSKRSDCNLELLRMTMKVLELTRLVHTDNRGEGWRWYANVPWPMLAMALSECCVCSDPSMVRRYWPTLDWWYQQHQVKLAQCGEDPSRGNLAKLVQRVSSEDRMNYRAISSKPSIGSVSSAGSEFPMQVFDPMSWISDPFFNAHDPNALIPDASAVFNHHQSLPDGFGMSGIQ